MVERGWQLNFRCVPQAIVNQLNEITSEDVSVGCVKKIPLSDIECGKYSHIGIRLHENKVHYPAVQVPHASNGKSSHVNLEGKEIVRKDLPKVTKTFPIESPNFGDSSKGYHTVYMNRMVYLREYISPKLREITIEALGNESSSEPVYIFKIMMNEVLQKSSPRFEDDLLESLNLLQENVGAVGVYKSDASMADFLKTIHLHWEILPPGDDKGNLAKIISGFKKPSAELQRNIADRYVFLSKLRPVAFINGHSGFQRYFGAKFAEDLVVFENVAYGNAVYVMYEDWEALSKRSRLELLSSNNLKFDRVVHSKGWKDKVRAFVVGKRKGKV